MTEMVARVCPNCGAPVHGTVCQYCGSEDALLFGLEPGTPVMVSYKLNGKRITFQLSIEALTMTASGYDELYADNRIFKICGDGYDVNLAGRLIPFEHDTIPGRRLFYMVEYD